MTCVEDSSLRRSRGRPKGQASGEVIDRLIQVTEDLMRSTSHTDMTERMIATSANVSERLIHYYFGSKDGLIFSVISRCRDEISRDLRLLQNVPPDTPEPTRYLIKLLMTSYYRKPWVARVGASELSKCSSVIKDMLMQRYGASGFTFTDIRCYINRMRDFKVFDVAVNPESVARALISIIAAPYTMPPLLKDGDFDLGNLERLGWINYLTDLFDRQLRPSLYGPSTTGAS